jgi:hypothetical protein
MSLSAFTDSVSEMIAGEFAFDALRELRDTKACEIKDMAAAEKILSQLVKASIAHALSQVEGRQSGTMSFDEAMELARSERASVTRPGWGIFNALMYDDGDVLRYWRFDNCDGNPTGNGFPADISDEDRAATDWMLYQAPQDNWVDLRF